MNSEGFALNQIIILAQSEMRLAIARLQQEIFKKFFDSVANEVERRAKEAAEKAKQPNLFDERGKVLEFAGAHA